MKAGRADPRTPPADLSVRTFFGADGREYAILRFSRSDSAGPGLTPAEQEVASMMLADWSNLAIAAARQVSISTVANQVRSIFAKLGVSSRAQLAARST
jgi:DNA-binding CsgD family transcriptional regulator